MQEQLTGSTPTTPLLDQFGRQIRYLRMSVTDRCNLRCTYCMAEDMVFLPKAKVLSLEELTGVAKAFVALGVEKIRLTGGEPLVRKGIATLARNLGALDGLRELVMTTNGVLLDQYAEELKAAGMSRVNISLDTLDPVRFKAMTRFGDLQDVLRGISAAQKAGFARIKLNAVVLKGVNDHEVLDLTRFAVSEGLDISFIEEMPLGEITSHARLATNLTSATIQAQLATEFTLQDDPTHDPAGGPARYQVISGTATRVGFISPMSNNFCATCNRVRLTTEGQLLLCLGNEDALDLKTILRDAQAAGLASDQVEARMVLAIKAALQHKPKRHEFDPREIKIQRFMSATGG